MVTLFAGDVVSLWDQRGNCRAISRSSGPAKGLADIENRPASNGRLVRKCMFGACRVEERSIKKSC